MFSISDLVIAMVITAAVCVLITWLTTFLLIKRAEKNKLENLERMARGAVPAELIPYIRDIFAGRDVQKEVEEGLKKIANRRF